MIANRNNTKLGYLLHGFFPTVLLLCSMPLILLSRLPYSFSEYVIYLQLPLSLVCHAYLFTKLKEKSVYRRFIITIVALTGVFLFNMLVVGNITVKQILYAAVILPSITLLIIFVRIKTIWCHLLIVFALVVIIYRWFVIGLDPEEITINSRNYIVFYLFLYALPYYYKCYVEEKRPIIIYPVICFVLALLAIGRGSIIMSVILLFGWFYSMVTSSKHKLAVLLFLTAIVVYYIYYELDSDFLDLYFSRFENKGLNSDGRNRGWAEYMNSLSNPLNLILGTPINSLRIVRCDLDGSLHNSYMTLHARMGLACLAYFFLMVKSFVILYKNRVGLLFFYFLAVAVKAYVDADFPGVSVGGDINIYVMYILGLLLVSPKKKRIETKLILNH